MHIFNCIIAFWQYRGKFFGHLCALQLTKYGWYRYDSRFAIPVYDTDGEIERFNVFRVRMIVNHAANGKKYLYDMINIKKEKETGNPLKN